MVFALAKTEATIEFLNRFMQYKTFEGIISL